MPQQLGKLNKRVIELLGIDAVHNAPILLGESNISHIISKHPDDYEKYSSYISLILEQPDYIRKNPKDNSIEYVKEFVIEEEYVKVAIRVSNANKWYIRSLYTLNSNRVKNYIEKGTLIKY